MYLLRIRNKMQQYQARVDSRALGNGAEKAQPNKGPIYNNVKWLYPGRPRMGLAQQDRFCSGFGTKTTKLTQTSGSVVECRPFPARGEPIPIRGDQ
jgi:hypothetical protein